MNRLNSNSNEAFRLISHILQKDSKSSTYKLALLRSTIEILNENHALIYEEESYCYVPLAPICDKWIFYYTPFVFHDISQNSGGNISFYATLKSFISCYKGTLNDVQKGIARDIRKGFHNSERKQRYLLCVKEIAICIIRNPMKHIAYSYYQDNYQLYQKRANPSLNQLIKSDAPLFKDQLHNTFGYISFKKIIKIGLELFGSFIIGEKSILQNWASLTLDFKNNNHLDWSKEKLVQLLHHSTDVRSVEPPRQFYKKLQEKGNLYCVWSSKKLTKDFDTDHIIPYSYWKNNDIWNLLPSNRSINSNQKRDKIPSVERIQRQKDLILSTWELTHQEYLSQFEREVTLTLNITELSYEAIFKALCQKSSYLIEELGYEGW